MRMTSSLRQRLLDDRGVAAAMMTIGMVAFLGMSALVVDIGNAWQSRRHVITATDAAALAAARDYVQGNNGCATAGTADDYVTRNNANASMIDCDHVPQSGSSPGYVTVKAEVDVDYIFAPILGLTGTTVDSATTVKYENATTIKDGGLRPFGLCIEALEDLTPADRVPPGGPAINNIQDLIGDGYVYRIPYDKGATVPPCGSDGEGNWGMLDFDGVGGNDTKYWVQNGYDGVLSIGDVVGGETGNGITNAIKTELNYVKTLDKFTLPIFDNVTDAGGSNKEFTVSNFVVVQLDDYRTTPAPKASIDIEFLSETTQGGGGGGGVTDLGAYVIGICAVDNVNVTANCG